jgi:predicted signal transduction protein with EAL and GGDEF domain
LCKRLWSWRTAWACGWSPKGVETEAQLEALRQVRCDRVQGYLVGDPVSAQATAELLKQPREQSLLSKTLVEEALRRLRRRSVP